MRTKSALSFAAALGMVGLLASCTGGQWYSPMNITGSVAGATTALLGSTVSGGIRTGGADFVPNVPQNVQILTEAPSWDYVEVGLVQAQHGPFVTNTGVYEMLQWRAASIGADAVIVDKSFMRYHGRGDDFYISQPVRGVAIASPKNVSSGIPTRFTRTTPYTP